jgi:copper resistance protein D
LPSLLFLWVHLLSAIYWVGGMLFLTVVLAPVFRSKTDQPPPYGLFQQVARRFAKSAWISILILVLTGSALLLQHNSWPTLVGSWPLLIFIKLSLVFLLIVGAALHDFVIGPRMGQIRKKDRESLTDTERTLLQWSPWLARGVLVVGLAVVCTGAALSRS